MGDDTLPILKGKKTFFRSPPADPLTNSCRSAGEDRRRGDGRNLLSPAPAQFSHPFLLPHCAREQANWGTHIVPARKKSNLKSASFFSFFNNPPSYSNPPLVFPYVVVVLKGFTILPFGPGARGWRGLGLGVRTIPLSISIQPLPSLSYSFCHFPSF